MTNIAPASYIASLPTGSSEVISHMDKLIFGVFEGYSKSLWSGKFWGGTDQTTIGYGDMCTKQSRGKKVEWFKVGLAVQKSYFSLYVNTVVDS